MAIAQQITELAALTKADPEDLLAVVEDPTGGAVTKNAGFGKFLSTYNISAAEISLGLSNDDLDFKNDFGAILRYGENTTPGTTVLTTAVQNALDSNKEVFLPGEIVLVGGISLNTDNILRGAGNASILKLESGVSTLTRVVNIDGVNNVALYDFLIDGNKSGNASPTGDPGQDGGLHGLYVNAANHVYAQNIGAQNCHTDGMYVDGVSTDIVVVKGIFDANRRQGCSGISFDGLAFYYSIFSNTSGQAPQLGIDLEPNNSSESIKNFLADHCFFDTNAGGGFSYTAKSTTNGSIVLRKCPFTNAISPNFDIKLTGLDNAVTSLFSVEDCVSTDVTIGLRISIGAVATNTNEVHNAVVARTNAQLIFMRDLSDSSNVVLDKVIASGSVASTSAGVIDADRINTLKLNDCSVSNTSTGNAVFILNTNSLVISDGYYEAPSGLRAIQSEALRNKITGADIGAATTGVRLLSSLYSYVKGNHFHNLTEGIKQDSPTVAEIGDNTYDTVTTPHTLTTFASADATPSVSVSVEDTFFSNATGVTITRFDDGIAGQEIDIISKGATVYDTSTDTRLRGSSVDITTASGDITSWRCEVGGTTSSVWILTGFVDISADNSAGA